MSLWSALVVSLFTDYRCPRLYIRTKITTNSSIIYAGMFAYSPVLAPPLSFPVTAWDEPPGLPDGVPPTGRISRGDVLDIGLQVRTQARPAADLLVASFIWGWGAAGYGPRRLRDIRAAAGDQLEPSLQRALNAVNTDPASPPRRRLCLPVRRQRRTGPGQARPGAVVRPGRLGSPWSPSGWRLPRPRTP